jgi:hypothetical protein
MPEPDPSAVRAVMTALRRERLCMSCLVALTRVPAGRIEDAFRVLGRVLKVRRSIASCERCSAGADVDVFTLV